MSTAALLRQRLAETEPLVVPGAANALAARIIELSGFRAAYVTGAGVANSFLGAPDVGLVTASELAAHVGAIAEATPGLPVMVDADTGFGNAINVQRTVRSLERAGAAAIQLEDQVAPKKCGHFTGKTLVPVEEMVSKIEAALDARRDDATVIVARTDARAVEGFDAAIERAARYRDAGADLLFIEAPQSIEEMRAIPERVPGPHLVNIVQGGRTPQLPVRELAMFDVVLWANIALQAAMRGMCDVLSTLRETGDLASVDDLIVPWDVRQALVRKPEFDALEERFA